MKSHPTLDLIVPLYNESENIEKLVEDVASTDLVQNGLRRMILVNNGSTDTTGEIVERLAHKYAWIEPVTLQVNRMYGGGLHYGMLRARADYIGTAPGDNQVHPDDIYTVWKRLLQFIDETDSPHVFVKGKRTVRHDDMSIRFVSWCYTHYANTMLGLNVADVNAHPKIFHRSLLDQLPDELLRTFTFDAQLLFAAREAHWPIAEEPVTFLARRKGVSSWASKRIQVYISSIKQILAIRRIHKMQSGSKIVSPSLQATASPQQKQRLF